MNRIAFILLLSLCLGCKKDDVSPTGSLRITFAYDNTNTGVPYPNYYLYTEVSYSRNAELQSGFMDIVTKGKYQVVLTDLNPGNYVVVTGGGTNRREKVVQVIAGKEREYAL